MAALNVKELFPSQVVTAASLAGSDFSLGAKDTNLVATLSWSAKHNDTTMSMDVEHSPDGLLWFALGLFTDVTGANPSGQEALQITATAMSHVRAKVTLTGANLAVTPIVRLFFAKD